MFKDDDLFSQIEMMRAYIDITEKHGPSEQLLAFINFDNKLGEEIGLEDFGTLPLHVKSEILNYKIHKAVDDFNATENLLSILPKLLKFSKAVLSPIIKGTAIFGGLLITGILVSNLKAKERRDNLGKELKRFGLYPYQDYVMRINLLKDVFEIEKELLNHIPSGFDLKQWKDFKTNHYQKSIKAFEALKKSDNYNKEFPKTSIDKSGWTPENFKKATLEFVDLCKTINKFIEDNKGKTEHIVDWFTERDINDDHGDDEISPLLEIIEETLGYYGHTFNRTSLTMSSIHHNLNLAGYHFEIKK